jgi:hypothetical protein
LIVLPKLKEAGLADLQRVLDLFAAEKTSRIGVEKKSNLIVRKPLVKLCHGYLLT